MSDIDNITINYDSSVDVISVSYDNEIENITLSLGADIQSVYSVNNLVGNITLSYSASLSSGTASMGEYSYNINHNLSYDTPIVSIYDTSNKLVFADVSISNSNNVTIKAAIDLLGYKVVVQR